jgi:hypothetical protein
MVDVKDSADCCRYCSMFQEGPKPWSSLLVLCGVSWVVSAVHAVHCCNTEHCWEEWA